MQKIIILALLCAAAFAADVTKLGGTDCGTGYFKKMGVCQKCDLTCSACDGPAATDCTACATDSWTLATKECKCATATPSLGIGATAETKPICVAADSSVVLTHAKCEAWGGIT